MLRSLKKVVQSGLLLTHFICQRIFDMVTMKQKEGNCIEHTSDNQLAKTSNPQVWTTACFCPLLPDLYQYLVGVAYVTY